VIRKALGLRKQEANQWLNPVLSTTKEKRNQVPVNFPITHCLFAMCIETSKPMYPPQVPFLLQVLLASFLLIASSQAGSLNEWRTWKSAAGTEMEARLLEATDTAIVLEIRNGKRITVTPRQLSEDDRKFIEEATNSALTELLRPEADAAPEEQVIAEFPAQPGKVSAAITCRDAPEWSYFVYLPKSFRKTRQYPVLFVMDPGGGKAGTSQRYVAAAERHGFITAVSKESKNSFVGSLDAILAMVSDVKSRLPIIPELCFASGMSGGSRMAYLLAETDHTIAGLVACGSGMGVYPDESSTKNFREARIRSGLPVYSLEGTNCFNRDEAVRSHNIFDATRCRLTFFPGKHEWASPALIADGLTFVLGVVLSDINKPEATSKAERPSLSPSPPANLGKISPVLREQQIQYSRALWKRTLEAGLPSWEKADWEQRLADFPGEPLIKIAAAKAAAISTKAPEVLTARAAEEAVITFAKKHFTVYEGDKKPNPEREAEAEQLASKFEKLPQAEVFRLLGKPQGK
jgi:hypothetical protein